MTPDEKVLIEVETNVELKARLRQAVRLERWRLVILALWLFGAFLGIWAFAVLLALWAATETIGRRTALLGWEDTLEHWKKSVGYVEEKE